MPRLPALGAVLLSLPLVAPAVAADANEFQVFNWDRLNDGAVELPGRLYVPEDYDPAQSYPFVTFYHGAGERGSNNTAQVNSNINNLLAAAKSRGFFLYAAQVPTDNWWNVGNIDIVQKKVVEATRLYNIDTARLYATGISMGGQGTWDTISRYDEVYAAAAPICGVTSLNNTTLPATMVGDDIWTFHGRGDPTVNVSHSRNLVNAVRAADGNKPAVSFPLNTNVNNPYYNTGAPYYSSGSGHTYYSENRLRYTEYNSNSHNTWAQTYGDASLYDWMLTKSAPMHTPDHGEAILFDLGATADTGTDTQGRTWNSQVSWGSSRTLGPAMTFAKTTTGERTAVSLEVADKFTGDSAGLLVPGSGLPDSIAGDAWSTGSWSGNAAAQAEAALLRVVGLDPAQVYAVELFGTHTDDDGGRGRVARFTIDGLFYDLDLVGNVDETALFTGILPAADGSISIDVRAAPGTTSRFAYVSWFSVTAVPEPVSFAALGIPLVVLRRRR